MQLRRFPDLLLPGGLSIYATYSMHPLVGTTDACARAPRERKRNVQSAYEHTRTAVAESARQETAGEPEKSWARRAIPPARPEGLYAEVIWIWPRSGILRALSGLLWLVGYSYIERDFMLHDCTLKFVVSVLCIVLGRCFAPNEIS